ncbi:MAG: hypothetical protein Kow0031_37920 [Anaerolineae bacterium]
MTHKDYLWLFAIALLVRLLAAWPQEQPNYMDAAYYYVNAVNLVEGRGFVEDFVWNYLNDPGPPPQPSHLYWMPLTSLLAAAGMLLGGINYRAAQVAFVLLAALLAPISYRVAWRLSGGDRWLSWLAGLLAVFSGFYVAYWAAIDNFAPFAVAGSLALLLAAEAATQGSRGAGEQGSRGKFRNSQFTIRNSQLLLAGVMAGLAHLSRADGVLILVTIELFLFMNWMGKRGWGDTPQAPRPAALVWPLLGYLLTMLPWFIRNWQVAGAPLPAGGTQAIWLSDYNDLFSYGRELSAATFLAQGWGAILAGRWLALITNLQTVVAAWGLIVAAPLAAIGGWARRRDGLVQLAALYGLLLFGAMTLLFPFPGMRGGLFHSGAALLPFVFGAAAVGLDVAINWMARRRRGWRVQSARRVFGVALVLIAAGLSLFLYNQRVLRHDVWNRADAGYPALIAWVQAQNPAAVVMIGNPPAWRYHGGGLSVITPNEDPPTTQAAARRYGVRYLILDRNHPPPLAELYRQPDSAPGLRLVEQFGDTLIFEVGSKE